jgi:hypothetical protein
LQALISASTQLVEVLTQPSQPCTFSSHVTEQHAPADEGISAAVGTQGDTTKMGSRLQKLLKLLESKAVSVVAAVLALLLCQHPSAVVVTPNDTLTAGTNEGTRKAASQQICDIAKAHPSQLVSITRKVGVSRQQPTLAP